MLTAKWSEVNYNYKLHPNHLLCQYSITDMVCTGTSRPTNFELDWGTSRSNTIHLDAVIFQSSDHSETDVLQACKDASIRV